MKILFETNDGKLIDAIQHWFEELKHRVYNTGLEFNPDDFVAIKEEACIIVMANVLLTDYDADLVPFQRRNVTIEYKEQTPENDLKAWVTDSGRYIWNMGADHYQLKVRMDIKLMPIYYPNLIITLNEDGTLIKDGDNGK